MLRAGVAWMIAMAWSPAAVAQESATVDQAACPQGKPLRAPDYPVDMIRRGITGLVVLDLGVDACGRVIDAKVKQGDKPAFNKAALASVEGVTLTAPQRANVNDGRVTLPIDFKIGALNLQKVDWPATHKRPRYVRDDMPTGYATPEAANAAIQSPPGQVWPSPYAVRSRFVQLGEPGAREFWLFVLKDGRVNLAARYRPVLEASQPVVKLAFLCADTAEACAKAENVLLEGLPYAKSHRS